ncbi:phage baseplate assembly protein V [Dyadobacter sp. CY261]|uniref:phage baseplate assembly protein V n=1 Tax=Dyadobacter sp. CY261 TaxID=2907203 RepID=UPI001F45A3C4|nr:phage baseplate assembly protein V [Dyadobacter sp. CY261]MCF0074341.1 phage baseplate assembly protein V [Dyadobacter sp. CY261]
MSPVDEAKSALDTATAQPTHTVSVTVLMDGKDITKKPGGLSSLSIYNEVNRIPTAKLVISDGEVDKGSFKKSGSADFVPGKKADVKLGYQNKTESIFKGIVIRHSINAYPGKASVMELECKDVTVCMTTVRQSRYYAKIKDSAVFKQLIENYKDSDVKVGDLAETDFEHPELVQYHCTDWDFLVLRAEANGLVVVVDNGTVHVKKPAKASKANHSVMWGEDIINFEAEMDTRTHYPDVTTATWDHAGQKVVQEEGSGNSGGGAVGGLGGGLSGAAAAVATVASAFGLDLGLEDDKHHFPDVLFKNRKPQLFHGGALAGKELSTWAKAFKARAELSQVRGRVRVRGKNFKTGQTLELKKTASRFNGTHFMTGVVHQLFSGTWQTDIQFGLSVKTLGETAQHLMAPQAGGLYASVHGLQIGTVTKLESDEEPGGGRVKVRIPWVGEQKDSNKDGVWARVAAVTAGKERGFVFRPEVDDEVILGFINNDPNNAVILGSAFSSDRKAPVEASKDNFQKGVFAKSGMKFVFDDDQKSIEMTTKEGYSVKVDEKGKQVEIRHKKQQTFIRLTDSGIEFSSAGDITLKAAGKVKIKGKEVRLNDPG